MPNRTTAAALPLLAIPAAQAALFDRGGGLIYDSVLNITGCKTPSTPGPAAAMPTA